jgi:hypothetical protein
MWLITKFGFFSIVQKPDDPGAGTLTVRARVKKDLEQLQARYLPDLGPIEENSGADYRYRAKAPRNSVAVAMLEAVRDIGYANFKSSVVQHQSAERAQLYEEVWETLHQLQEQEKPHGTASEHKGLTFVAPNTSYGGVLFDDSGRVLLRENAGHFDGYHWTFAKGLPKGTTDLAATVALNEVLNKTGYHGEILGRIPGIFKGGTGQSVYFAMRPTGAPVEPDYSKTQAIRWVSPSEARTLIAQTPKEVGRKRDLSLLEAALTTYRVSQPESYDASLGEENDTGIRSIDLYRLGRLLLRMVRTLHRRGFESLRIQPSMAPSGCYWRCAIAPASLFTRKHGARLSHAFWDSDLIAHYSSGSLADFYGWGDCSQCSPGELADRFEEAFPITVRMARNEDPDYAHWYQHMIIATEPIGMPIAFADWTVRQDMLEIICHPDVHSFPLPPPGLAE